VTPYVIGQIIYVVLRKEARVYPMQVIEIVTKKTLEGEAVTYMVKGGTGADQVLPIADVDGEIFDSADKVRHALVERATLSIGQRVDQAVTKAKEWYPGGFEADTMGAGLAAIRKPTPIDQVTAPKAVKPPKPKPATSPELAELATELQEESTVIELSDGSRAKVKSVKLPSALQG
jgi:hypothetical protein